MIKFDIDTDLRFRASLDELCIELHQFTIHGYSSQLYEVIGYTHQNVVIICAVARKATL